MAWEVEYTGEFGEWWAEMTPAQQDRIAATVRLLEARGPQLPFPFSSGVKGSRHEHMRELRVQSRGNPLRIFYAFDPRRTAILLIGGDKTGKGRFYDEHVPWADELYDAHLQELRKGRAHMTGRHKFAQLEAKLAPVRRARIDRLAEKLGQEADLAQLRAARQLSQAALGEILHVEQPAVAKLEKRTDMYVSTLRRFVEAMGGQLEIVARFPDGAVRIRNFADLASRLDG